MEERDGEFEEGQADERGVRERRLVAEAKDFSFDLGGKKREGSREEFRDGLEGSEGGCDGGRGADGDVKGRREEERGGRRRNRIVHVESGEDLGGFGILGCRVSDGTKKNAGKEVSFIGALGGRSQLEGGKERRPK